MSKIKVNYERRKFKHSFTIGLPEGTLEEVIGDLKKAWATTIEMKDKQFEVVQYTYEDWEYEITGYTEESDEEYDLRIVKEESERDRIIEARNAAREEERQRIREKELSQLRHLRDKYGSDI